MFVCLLFVSFSSYTKFVERIIQQDIQEETHHCSPSYSGDETLEQLVELPTRFFQSQNPADAVGTRSRAITLSTHPPLFASSSHPLGSVPSSLFCRYRQRIWQSFPTPSKYSGILSSDRHSCFTFPRLQHFSSSLLC